MKIANGKIVPDYHPQIIVNARNLLDRVPTTGTAEADALVTAAKLLQAIIDGHYHVVSAPIDATPETAEPDLR